MIPFILGGLVGVIGTIFVLSHWDEIVDWLKDFAVKIRKALVAIAHGVKVFAQALKDAYVAFRHRLYYKQEGQWYEETTTRKIEASEVPADIMASVTKQEKDMTRKFEELELVG